MQLKVTTTTAAGALLENRLFPLESDAMEKEVLNIYDDLTYQAMEGFGGALTDAAGYVFAQMEKEQREELLETYFGMSAMGYNRVRIPLDGCDFATHMYEADSLPEDENLLYFSMAETEKYILPLLAAAQEKAARPLKLMLSAWSPPAYMKTNGSRTGGGSLKPQYRARWARYLCRYIMEFQKRGYYVERISVQNEPKAAQTWDSCIYSAQEEKEFVRDYLVPELEAHGLGQVEIFVWDHNKERVYERMREVMDETTEKMITGIAFHWYSGDHFETLDMVRERFPDKKLILSESCLEFSVYDKREELPNAQRLAHDMIGNLNHGMNAFYDWNILLDSDGGPNHAKNYCDAPFLYDMTAKKLQDRLCRRYYWHFCHFIKPGAVRAAVSKYTDSLDFTAWKNPDGQLIYVLLNRTDRELRYYLRFRGFAFAFTALPHSISSGELL